MFNKWPGKLSIGKGVRQHCQRCGIWEVAKLCGPTVDPGGLTMVEILYHERKDLRLRIDDQLLGYLNADDGRTKLRSKLQSNMWKYLSYAQHNNKFHFPETSDVLRQSITGRSTFSGERASYAWAALAKYAENLVRQPWRKEFREIKLYCGFYKHEVEGNLIGAEIMLEAMGYMHVDRSIMILADPFDADRIACVAKDAMMAEVECLILQEVWEKVSKCDITWAEILEYREQFASSPEKLVQGIVYQVRLRRYHENQNLQQLQGYGTHYEGQHMPHHRLSHQPMPYPAYNSIMPLNNYHCGVGYNYPPQQTLKPHDFYPSNGHLMPMRPPCYTNYNGYNQHFSSIPTTVPTGELIELNTSPVHLHQMPLPLSQYRPPEPVRTTEIPSSRAKDDGAGSWEVWDDVYHKLENKTTEKQMTERMRAMRLNRATTPPPSIVRSEVRARTDGDGASRHRLSKTSFELGDAVLSKGRLHKNSSESEAEGAKIRPKRNIESVKPPKPPQPEPQHYANNNQTDETNKFVEACTEKPEPKIAGLRPVRHVVTLDVSPKFTEETSKKNNDPNTWECHHCTFFNSSSKSICEMCDKSKYVEDVPPQPCGGSECPNCTLVNEKGKNYCSVCNAPLKDSPTYI